MLEEIQGELFPEPEPIVDSQKVVTAIAPLPTAAGVHFGDSPYQRYRCLSGDPLRCDKACGEDEIRLKACNSCGFPTLLPEKAEIRGQLGTYQIEDYIGRRGLGRLYRATQQGMNLPVVIKEYLLPGRYFNAGEARLQKQIFQSVAGVDLADGRSQDLRLLEPLEAIVDDIEERCYLVMDERYLNPTLNSYLTREKMTSLQVRWVLNQGLQTLIFLHGQKFRFPSGQVQDGIAHGNLSLDNLLLVASGADEFVPVEGQKNLDFYLYFCDLAVWEQLFLPLVKPTVKEKYHDLISLGYVAFYLLTGRVITEEGEPLDPRQESHWQGVEPHLKAFILRLMQIEMPFVNAEVARKELLKLPQPEFVSAADVTEEGEVTTSKPQIPVKVLLLGALGLGVIGGLAWLLFGKPQLSNAAKTPQVCCLKDVGAIPPGKFAYTATNQGIWHYILQQRDLIQKGQTLEERLQAAQPKLQLIYEPAESTDEAISKVRNGQAAFAIAPLIHPLPSDLQAQEIAYDGLAVFVSFSYSQREKGLPEQLQGKLTLTQLQQLYGKGVDNWQEFTNSTLPVKTYTPDNKEAMEVFQQKVLPGNEESQSLSLPEFEMMRTVIRDFESAKVGAIGFSSLAKITSQCSVYPLALQTSGKNPVQPLVFKNGKAIEPSTDLCDRKGNYHPDAAAIRSGRYPLGYAIAVIYPRDNNRPAIGEKFATILKTREGQRLLGEMGLVPLE
ncbi:hypothetical protein IJ00_03525 [Calothrix sp. 336/3]|nr:hypothetical protein IJ00_03525 [Calothrix sp. 336/3]